MVFLIVSLSVWCVQSLTEFVDHILLRNPQVMSVQLGDERRRKYNFRRFARFFQGSKSFLIMITLCHICCNSDVFLTFPSLKSQRSAAISGSMSCADLCGIGEVARSLDSRIQFIQFYCAPRFCDHP